MARGQRAVARSVGLDSRSLDTRADWPSVFETCLAMGMVLRGLRNRLNEPIGERDRERLGARYSEVDSTPISDAPLRSRVRIAGEIKAVTVVPGVDSPRIEVTLDDGSGTTATGVFLGRVGIGGLVAGRGAQFEGVLQNDGHRLAMLNPGYELL